MEMLLDDETLHSVRHYLPEEDSLSALTDFYAIFSDPTRVRVISALSIAQLCVSDICTILQINQTTCSHQLKILRAAGIVGTRRDGKLIFYYLKNLAICDVLLVGVKYLGF
ncbi:MAG: metalloregulator ArsR/SmtB family transcription factor [Clostridiaceae bacterium]|nr:metalloregulator ArsR/SmtB family transcription factor [Clostridiaceae bacterium]